MLEALGPPRLSTDVSRASYGHRDTILSVLGAGVPDALRCARAAKSFLLLHRLRPGPARPPQGGDDCWLCLGGPRNWLLVLGFSFSWRPIPQISDSGRYCGHY